MSNSYSIAALILRLVEAKATVTAASETVERKHSVAARDHLAAAKKQIVTAENYLSNFDSTLMGAQAISRAIEHAEGSVRAIESFDDISFKNADNILSRVREKLAQVRSLPPGSYRGSNNHYGCYNRWIWFDLGARRLRKDRNHYLPWVDKLKLGVEFSAPSRSCPYGGGVPFQWCDLTPTGEWRVDWQ